VNQSASEKLLSKRFLILLAAAFGVFLGNGIVTPVLPVFVKDGLGGGDVAVGVVVAVQAISAIAIRPWITPKFNTWGVKPILIGAIIAVAISLGFSGVVHSVIQLIALRLLLGAGIAVLFIGSLTAVTSWVPADRAGESISMFSVAPYISMGLGPLIGQLIFHAMGYTFTFALAGFVAAVGVIAMLFLKSEPLTTADLMNQDIASKRFYKGAVWPGVVIALGIVGMLSFGAFMPLFALEIPGLQIQIAFLILAGVVLLFRTGGGKLPDMWGPKKTSIVATTALMIGMAGVATTPFALWAYIAIVPFAFGQALQYPGLLSLTLEDISERDRPVAISTFTLFFDISQGFGGLFVGVVAAVAGYRAVFGSAALCAFIGLIIMLLVVLPRYEDSKRSASSAL